MGFRTSRFWFPAIPLSCHPNYRALTFALAGLSPAEHTSLSWLQPPHQLISGRNRVPYQGPSCIVARAQGSKGDGTHLLRGVLQPRENPITHPPWKRYNRFVLFAAILFALENRAFRYDTGLEIAPKRDQ
jgi:hypothetical protein